MVKKIRLAPANPFFSLEFLHKQLNRGLKIFAITAINIFQTVRVVDSVSYSRMANTTRAIVFGPFQVLTPVFSSQIGFLKNYVKTFII